MRVLSRQETGRLLARTVAVPDPEDLLGRLPQPDVLAWVHHGAGLASGFASALGHQMRRPMSKVSAVTSTDLTTIVSSSTPSATATPISVNSTSGNVPSMANVPASTRPAEVMTPPVAARPASAPRLVPDRADSSRTRVIRKML